MLYLCLLIKGMNNLRDDRKLQIIEILFFRSRSQVVRLEGEIARVSRQKEMLEDQLR